MILLPVGGAGQAMAAFRQSDGSVVWKKDDAGNAYSSPLLINVDGFDQVVQLMAASVFAINPLNGDLSWYVKHEAQAATIASRTMRWGGALLLVFIVVHILHLTTGTIRPAGSFSHQDVYANVVTSFRIWWVSLFYIVAMIALGFHLFHGAWSSVRSIGVSPPSPNPLHHRVSLVLAILIWAAFTAIPVAVLTGFVR